MRLLPLLLIGFERNLRDAMRAQTGAVTVTIVVEWQDVFVRPATRASGIVIVPSTTAGTLDRWSTRASQRRVISTSKPTTTARWSMRQASNSTQTILICIGLLRNLRCRTVSDRARTTSLSAKSTTWRQTGQACFEP